MLIWRHFLDVAQVKVKVWTLSCFRRFVPPSHAGYTHVEIIQRQLIFLSRFLSFYSLVLFKQFQNCRICDCAQIVLSLRMVRGVCSCNV
jgi:hypothetical protein